MLCRLSAHRWLSASKSDADNVTVNLTAVKVLNCRLGQIERGEFNERVPLWQLHESVNSQLDVFDAAIVAKYLAEVFRVDVPRQVAHVQHSFLGLVRAPARRAPALRGGGVVRVIRFLLGLRSFRFAGASG